MKTLTVYKELGLLAASEESAASALQTGERHLHHPHTALWDYCDPGLARPYAAGIDAPEVFATPPPGTTLPQAMEMTRFLVFIGARDSAEFRTVLARASGVCLVFEPDLAELEACLKAVRPHTLSGKGVFFVGGDPDRLDVPLLSMLPEAICGQGYPLFFVREGLEAALPEYVRRVEEMIELFYYRNVIYALDGQETIRGLPLRPMARDAILDRFKHVYENLAPALGGGSLEDLLGALAGETAILAAAGPALAGSLDFIRRNRDRAAVIAVNSAVKPLLGAGIEPHFAIINDTSLGSEPTLSGLPELGRTILVAHFQSYSGGGSFPRLFFFGNFPGQPFPKRHSLMLHGSVITTAFSLAEYLGCSRALLAGVQLASPDPYRMNYAAGSLHENHASGATRAPLSGRWPELYPVTAADGSRLHTTLNFLDAAQWFADRIRSATLRVTNLCPTSILKGPGIEIDPDPALPESPGLDARIAAISPSGRRDRAPRVLGYIENELARWKKKQVAARQAAASLGAAAAFIAACDADNSSFMLQRFEDFDNARFHAGFFEALDAREKAEAASYFLQYMERMSQALVKLLLDQHRRVKAL
jgi:hypothetical protein